MEGVSELLDTIERIRAELNPGLVVEGVVLTMFDERTNLAQQVAEELKKYFGDKLCTTTIPRNIRLAEAPSHGLPALVYDVRSRGAESYIRLAKEILDRQAVQMRPLTGGKRLRSMNINIYVDRYKLRREPCSAVENAEVFRLHSCFTFPGSGCCAQDDSFGERKFFDDYIECGG